MISNIKKVHSKSNYKAACQAELSTYYLEYGHHLVWLHRCHAYTPTSNIASHDHHEKINSWVSFYFLECGALLGGPSGRQSCAMTFQNWFNCSSIRNWIVYVQKTTMVDKDFPIDSFTLKNQKMSTSTTNHTQASITVSFLNPKSPLLVGPIFGFFKVSVKRNFIKCSMLSM